MTYDDYEWQDDDKLSKLPFSTRYQIMREAEQEAEKMASHASNLRFDISRAKQALQSNERQLEDLEYRGSKAAKFVNRMRKLLDQDLPKPE